MKYTILLLIPASVVLAIYLGFRAWRVIKSLDASDTVVSDSYKAAGLGSLALFCLMSSFIPAIPTWPGRMEALGKHVGICILSALIIGAGMSAQTFSARRTFGRRYKRALKHPRGRTVVAELSSNTTVPTWRLRIGLAAFTGLFLFVFPFGPLYLLFYLTGGLMDSGWSLLVLPAVLGVSGFFVGLYYSGTPISAVMNDPAVKAHRERVESELDETDA